MSARRYNIRALDRGLSVLELLRDAGRPLGLQEIAQQMQIAKSSAFRLLCTLELRGYVERTDGGPRYNLGVVWMSYGRQPAARPLSEIALPYMRQLVDRFGETVSLAIPGNGQIVYVEMLESPQSLRMAARVGATVPLHSTALGKAIAAFLPGEQLHDLMRHYTLKALTPRTITSRRVWLRVLKQIRKAGYSEDREETEHGAGCMGAPIFAGPGRSAIGALSISGPTVRIQGIKAQAIPALLSVCGAISQTFGYRLKGGATVDGKLP